MIREAIRRMQKAYDMMHLLYALMYKPVRRYIRSDVIYSVEGIIETDAVDETILLESVRFLDAVC